MIVNVDGGGHKMEEQVIINKTYRASSFETGSPGKRFKLYFEDAQDLENQINALKEKKLFEDDLKTK